MKTFLFGLIAAGMATTAAPALIIDIDYTYSGGYFTTNPGAKTALEKAVLDVESAITSTFAAVPADSFTGGFGATSVTLDWGYSFENPSNSAATVTVGAPVFAPDHFTLYVGAAALPDALGIGGGVAVSTGFVIGGSDLEFASAMAAAVSLSNSGMVRGAGPVTTLDGSITFGSVTANYALQTGLLAGQLSMNSTANWHFDLNSQPLAGESDFYSVALHEILHSLGFGTSQTWDGLVSGANWTGAHAIALHGGSGFGLVSTDGGHIAEGTMSTSIVTGLPQEVAMDPTLTEGTTKTLTALDLGFLQDLGYTTVAVPEPRTLAMLGLAAFGVLAARRRAGLESDMQPRHCLRQGSIGTSGPDDCFR